MMNLQQPAWLDDVPLDLDAAITGPAMRVSDLLALEPGAIVFTTRPAGENIDIFAGGRRIGSGEFSASGSRGLLRMVRLG